jgi:hypothetical protein
LNEGRPEQTGSTERGDVKLGSYENKTRTNKNKLLRFPKVKWLPFPSVDSNNSSGFLVSYKQTL